VVFGDENTMTASNNERCSIQIEPSRSITIVPAPNVEFLNEQQIADYREYRYAFIDWMMNEGKHPEKREGYSDYTTYETAYKTARFDRYAWNQEDRYTTPPTPGVATQYIETDVAYRDVTNATKGKTEEALARYYRYLSSKYQGCEWGHDQIFNSSGDAGPRDYLTRQERRRVREAALETNDWREASIVLISLDAALRPIEVRRASTEWVDTDNRMLRIPREDSSKNEGNWRTSLTERSTTAVKRWIDERDTMPAYDDTDALWLTRERTRYSSRSLARLLRRLCDQADIDRRGRSMTWYSIRHSTGTYMTAERDLKAAKDQLRHKSAQTTMKYDQVPVDQRRDALSDM
jgi:integrase